MKLSLFKIILIGVFCVGAIAGLIVFSTYSNGGGGAKNQVGTVVIWGTLPKDQISSALTASAREDTSFRDVSYVEKDAKTLADDLTAAIATGNAPDLVLASQEELQGLVPFIEPLTGAKLSAGTFESSFPQGAGLFALPDGSGYYGIPFLIDPLVLFSNRGILSSQNIAKPPATWEAFTGLVPAVAAFTPARQITRGLVALGTYDNVHDARAILSALFLQTGVPISKRAPGGALVADLEGPQGGGTTPGKAVVNFYTQFADPSKISYTWNASMPDSSQSFLAGNLALYLGYASEARFLKAANPNLDFLVSAFPQPATAQTKITYGRLYAFMIPRGARNPSGAYQIAALLTNSTEQNIAAQATGLAPASLSALATPPTDDAVAAVAYAEALRVEGWLSPLPQDTDRVFSSMIGSVVSGRSTPDGALVAAERSLSALLSH